MTRLTKYIAISTIFFVCVFIYLFNLPCCAQSDSFLTDAIISTSAEFLGRPYKLDPLGEGQGAPSDSDPLYRTDVFDCLSYVETVLATAITKTSLVHGDIPPTDSKGLTAQITSTLNHIRYFDGQVSFTNRHHFQYPDWTNGNKEILSFVTEDIANATGITTANSTITLCRSDWFKRTHNHNVPDAECEEASLTYIPLSEMRKHISALEKNITTPLVFMTVINDPTLPEKVGTAYNISHTGFVISINGKLHLRHASSLAKRVVDSNFERYITSLQHAKKYLGFALLKINQ